MCFLAGTGCEEPRSAARRPVTVATTTDEGERVVARVNGAAIYRKELEDILYRGRGATLLEDRILLEMVRQEARRRGIGDDAGRVQQERQRMLDDMAPGKSYNEQEALLRYMLRRRGLTGPEFDVILEKQALLREMTAGEVAVTEEDIARQFERDHGEKAQVREIVVGTLARVDEAMKRLAAGESFAAVAASLSEDELTSPDGGLMAPLSREDDDVPAGVREAAFGLRKPGGRSEPVHYVDGQGRDRWALLELVQYIPADGMALDQVRAELTQTVRQRLTNAAMLGLQQSLREKAHVDIIDPALRKPAAP